LLLPWLATVLGDAVSGVSPLRQMTTGQCARWRTWSLTEVDVNVLLSRPRPRDPSTISPAFSCDAALMMTSTGLPLSIIIRPGSCAPVHTHTHTLRTCTRKRSRFDPVCVGQCVGWQNSCRRVNQTGCTAARREPSDVRVETRTETN